MTWTTSTLGPDHLAEVRAALSRDVGHHLYLLGLIEEFGLVSSLPDVRYHYVGAFEGQTLGALAFVGGTGGLIVCSRGPAAAHTALAQHAEPLGPGALKGEPAAVEAWFKAWPRMRPTVVRKEEWWQVSADDLGPFTNPRMRLAELEDLPRLLPLAAACVRETWNRDPLDEDPLGFSERVRQRIRRRRTYLYEEDGAIVFKVDLGSRSRFGAELEGVYTAPEARRRGHATLCLGQISRHLLSSLPRLGLRVPAGALGLATAARKVGYHRNGAETTALWETAGR